MPTMTAEQAEQLRDEFCDRFSGRDAFEASWRRCFETLKRPSAESARRWLMEDLGIDDVMAHGLLPKEPALPLRQQFELSDCPHCGGKRYVKTPIPDSLTRAEAVRYPGFGVANPCQFCDDSAHKTSCDLCRKAAENLAESAKNSGQKARRNRGKKSEKTPPARDYVGELARKMRMP